MQTSGSPKVGPLYLPSFFVQSSFLMIYMVHSKGFRSSQPSRMIFEDVATSISQFPHLVKLMSLEVKVWYFYTVQICSVWCSSQNMNWTLILVSGVSCWLQLFFLLGHKSMRGNQAVLFCCRLFLELFFAGGSK